MHNLQRDFLRSPQKLKDISFWEDIGCLCVEKFFGQFVCGIGKDFKPITDIITISIHSIEQKNNNDHNFIVYNDGEYAVSCEINIDCYGTQSNSIKILNFFDMFKTALLLEFKTVISTRLMDLEDYTNEELSDEIVKQACYKVANDLRDFFLKELGIDIDVLSSLTTLKYENRICNEFNVLFVKNSSAIKGLHKFCEVTIDKNNIRQIRKLLELLNKKSEQYYLVYDMEISRIVGITHSDLIGNCVYRLVISDRIWKLYTGDISVCQFSDNNFKIMEININIFGFNYQINHIVKTISDGCSHGALIFVFPDKISAENAVNDLSNRTRIYKLSNPIDEVNLIAQFCEIDGAIFLDNDGKCYGFGGISDGAAKVNGNIARGARYNAAITYVSSFESHPLAIILSEDGGIDCKCDKECKIIKPTEICYKENPPVCT